MTAQHATARPVTRDDIQQHILHLAFVAFILAGNTDSHNILRGCQSKPGDKLNGGSTYTLVLLDDFLDLGEILVVQPVDTGPVGDQVSDKEVGLIRGAARHETVHFCEGRSRQQTRVLEENGTCNGRSNGGISRRRGKLKGSDPAVVLKDTLLDVSPHFLVVVAKVNDLRARNAD